MKRREFIGMTAAGAAGLVWPGTASGSASLAPAALTSPHLLTILRDERLVRDLGRRYRASVPSENDARVLEQAILADMATADPHALTDRIDAQVLHDFSTGRTVTVDGWILSLTEARQCALYSLRIA